MSVDTVLALAGSPRRGGNTDLLLAEAMRGARDAGHEVIHVVASELDLSGCVACGGCSREGRCVVMDDMQHVFIDLDRAHHVIVAAPIFFMGLPGQLKNLIDRCQLYWSRKYVLHQPSGRQFPGGNAGAILVGGTDFKHVFDGSRWVLKSLCHCLELHYTQELCLRHIDQRGDIQKHPEHLEAVYNLGLNISGITPSTGA